MTMGPGLVKDKIVITIVAIDAANCALSNAVAAPDKIWGIASHVVPENIYPSLQA
jgi:cysteine synthase